MSIAAVALIALTAAAESESASATLLPQHRVVYENQIGGRLNPLGVVDKLNLEYRYRLSEDPGILWRNAHVAIGLSPLFTPSVLYLGGTAKLKPIAVAEISASAYWVRWMDTFQYLQSYPSANAPHSDSDLDAGDDAGRAYATSGWMAQLALKLLAKMGPFVARNTTTVFYGDMDLRTGDAVYYDIVTDLMLPDAGWSLTNDLDLVWLSDFGLVAGVRTAIGHAFYDSSDNPNTPTVRAGPLLAYVLGQGGPRFAKPTVVLIVNWYLKHRYRTGRDVSQGVPYIGFGFRFEGELWSTD